MRLNFRFLILFLFFGKVVFGQDIWMHPNRGQWHDKIQYKVEMSKGELLLSDNEFVFNLSNQKELMHEHRHGHSDSEIHVENVEKNIVRSRFPMANWSRQKTEENHSTFYRNYLLGNDKSKWKSKIYSVQKTIFHDFIDDIDLIWSTENQIPEFSFLVPPQANFAHLFWIQEGQKSLKVDANGNLLVETIFGEIEMSRPKAWNVSEPDMAKIEVDVWYKVDGNNISFDFPNGFDSTLSLLIDPELTFSTFTGSNVDNWGMSATPDVDGNLFGGGIVRGSGSGYPFTPGAFSSSYSGGGCDIAITKFNQDGTVLLYSTYIGGIDSETPNSMIASQNGELFIYGLTSSSDFPMAGSSFDPSYNGGPNLAQQSNSLGFFDGSDIFVARLSADGTSLIASTFVGGSDNDGMNISSTLKHNYGDEFRGEIILDSDGNVIVTSSSQSSDFPTQNAVQSSLSGGQDVVVFKMSNTLSSLIWSTYLGGISDDAGYSVQQSSNNVVYVTGGTSSSNLLTNIGASGGEDLSYNGGADGFLIRLDANTGAVSTGTFIGSSEYDQSYIVQLDIDNKAYVFGQTESDFGVSAGCYGVANSGQFLRKYSEDLSTIEWTTTLGAGSGHVEISPTAFLVSDCYDIYLSGWGGETNIQNSPFSTTNGFPVTPDAYQSSTNGNNFYLAVLGQDASILKYATFMGGLTASTNHVDGGTSRFDKEGRVYHSVCGSCANQSGNINNGFTTTPGAWSTLAGGPNCNMACFKFELSTIEAIVSDPQPLVCLPNPVVFQNNSTNGNSFFWDFGDGTNSTVENPSHVYSSAGNYQIMLVVSDTNSCFTPDSVFFTVSIGDFNAGVVQPTSPICPGETFQFEAYGGANYEWSPAEFLDNPNIFNPVATITETTDFSVVISDSCGTETVNLTLEVFEFNTEIVPDTSLCIGNSVQLFASGGVTYSWSPTGSLDNPESSTPIASPTQSTEYVVEITSSDNCSVSDTVQVDVYDTPPIPELADEVKLCKGDTIEVTAGGAQYYSWFPNIQIDTLEGPTVNISTDEDRWYYCTLTNVCGDTLDSVFLDVIIPEIKAFSDTTICIGQVAYLSAEGTLLYQWSPVESLLTAPNLSHVSVLPSVSTMYIVTGTDQFGCSAQDSVFVDLFSPPFVQTDPDIYAFVGDYVKLSASSSSNGTYVWSPAEYLSCVTCQNTVVNPNRNYTYVVTLTDQNGCVDTDSVNIIYDPILYLPNTFTPDGNEFNNIFVVEGGNIVEFEMLIFNRWGELVFESNNQKIGWDGTYNGKICQDGTYVWKLKYSGIDGKKYEKLGHVNLLR